MATIQERAGRKSILYRDKHGKQKRVSQKNLTEKQFQDLFKKLSKEEKLFAYKRDDELIPDLQTTGDKIAAMMMLQKQQRMIIQKEEEMLKREKEFEKEKIQLKYEKELIEKTLGHKLKREKPDLKITFDELLNVILPKFHQQGLIRAKGTYYYTVKVVEAFQKFNKIKYIEQATPEMTRNFLDDLLTRIKPPSARNRMAYLKGVYTKLIENGYYEEENPIKYNSKLLYLSPKKNKAISLEDFTQVMKILKIENEHLYNGCKLLLYMGLRPQELFQMQWEHVQDDYIELKDSKTSKPGRPNKMVKITPEIRKIIGPNQKQGYIFPNDVGKQYYYINFVRKIERILKKHGITRPFSIGQIRHTRATELGKRKDLTISELHNALGHTNIKQTLHYIHHERTASEFDSEYIKAIEGEN